MNELIKVKVENVDGVLVTTSNRVAEELEVLHKDLLGKIDGYVNKFSSAKLSAQFYIPFTYKALNGRVVRNYLITEKGIAQLIGGYSSAVSRAFELNVAYINEFERMRKHIKSQKLPQTYLEALKELVKIEEEKERLLKENIENKPKIEYHDKVLDSNGTLTVREIAQDFGKTANWLNKMLNSLGVQYKQGSKWHLYAKYKDLDLVKEITIYDEENNKNFTRMKWTQKGREFIHNLLRENEIIG